MRAFGFVGLTALMLAMAPSVSAQQSKIPELTYALPEAGCPTEMPDEASVQEFCRPIEQPQCGTKAVCVWEEGLKNDDGTREPGTCAPKRGTYIAAPSDPPTTFQYFMVAEVINTKADAAEKRAYDLAANKKYADAITVYTSGLVGVDPQASHQSYIRTHRGLVHEHKKDYVKALADYCMSVAYATSYDDEQIAKTRILQIAHPDLERVTIPQFARTGIIKNTMKAAAATHLTMTAPASKDTLVRVENSNGKNEFVYAYIRAGSTYKINLPLGYYRILTASGRTWYGPKEFFGPSTNFRKSINYKTNTEVYNFERVKTKTGTAVRYWTVKLEALDGNSTAEVASPKDFGDLD